jgi:hypothetical protein
MRDHRVILQAHVADAGRFFDELRTSLKELALFKTLGRGQSQYFIASLIVPLGRIR